MMMSRGGENSHVKWVAKAGTSEDVCRKNEIDHVKWDMKAGTSVDVCIDEGVRIKKFELKFTLWNQRIYEYHIAKGNSPGVIQGLHETLFKWV
jgi:hypothetical protein